MSFFSLKFVLFFMATLIIHNALPCRLRHYALLAASVVFYALFDLKYTLVLALIIIISYFGALRIEKGTGGKSSKEWLALSVFVCLAVLIFFKFWNYAFLAFTRLFGESDLSAKTAAVFLAPVGISFFTLEAVGYMVDVYRGKTLAERDFCKYALFISFFPKVMSGPIERSGNLLRQIREGTKFDYDKVKHSFLLILWGTFVKLLIANRLAVIVNAAFDNYYEQTGFTLLIAVIIYGIQLYADFAGYSYIAIGLAGAFGYSLMDNFIQPYFALNVRDFWRRWHVSLSSWLRDYVYIPLGGSRKGNLRRYLNLMITFLVSGLWHGTGLHFVLWGLIHGVFQVTSVLINKPALKLEGAGKAKERKTKADPDANRFSRRLVCAFFTFILVDFAWLFFRADSVGASLHILKRIVFSPEIGRTIFEGLCLAGVEVKKAGLLIAELFILLLVDLCHEKNIRVSEWLDGQDKWFRWTIYVTMAMFIIIGMLRDYGMDASTFIYAAF